MGRKLSASQSVEVNGWTIFAHPLFLGQLESLVAAVEADVKKGKGETADMKVLRGVHHFAFEAIPADPGDARFRQGNTLGPEYRHWYRAKFGNGRFRLFYRYRFRARVIVLGWVNDESTLRRRGDRRDAYAEFRRMLQSGNPPDTWDELYDVAKSSLLPRTTSCPGIPAPGTGARFLSPAGSEAGAHHHGVPLEPCGSIDVCQDPTYSLYMKPVQVMLDERLLEELDSTEEVAREGRSAVLRRALEDYLRRRRLVTIRERYERAYAAEPGLGEDFAGWTEEGTWPEE